MVFSCDIPYEGVQRCLYWHSCDRGSLLQEKNTITDKINVEAGNGSKLVLSVLETKDIILFISHGAVIKYRSSKSP